MCIRDRDKSANIKLAAKRIVFGKYLNCGQTCVAPDYIYCHSEVKDELLKQIQKQIRKQFGKSPLDNKNYGKIIKEKHFNRIQNLIDPAKVICGGNACPETLQIEPTVCLLYTSAHGIHTEHQHCETNQNVSNIFLLFIMKEDNKNNSDQCQNR